MTRSRAKHRMKIIPGGKQLSLIRDSEEVMKFLEFIAGNHSSNLSDLEICRKACRICFSLISEEEDHLIWILGNLSLIFMRASSLSHTDRELYSEAAETALLDFQQWSADPFEWERKKRSQSSCSLGSNTPPISKDSRKTLTFPIRADACVEVVLPKGGISVEDYLKLGLFLLPYCDDLKITKTLPWSEPAELL